MKTSDSRDLANHLADLLRRERVAAVDFLVALAEFDRRRCWAALGYANLFDFLHRDLGLSKGTAFYRKTGAELIQRYPEIVEPLRDGRLCITALHALSKAITPANRAEVLPRFFHASKQEAKAVSAELAPAPVVPRRDVVTSAPAPQVAAAAPASSQPVWSSPSSGVPTLSPPAPAPSLRPIAHPLTATETRLHITVSPEFLSKLEAAKLALSHAMPGATAEAVLAAGLDLILARDAKRKGLVERPRRAADVNEDSRYVPAEVRREVWKRDGGRCQWPLESGGVCGSRLRPELDHIRPWRLGGPTIVENLRVLCEVHNEAAARDAYGDALIERRRSRRRAGTSPQLPTGWDAVGAL